MADYLFPPGLFPPGKVYYNEYESRIKEHTLFGDRTLDVFKSFHEMNRSRVKISVEGYDTSLPLKDILDALVAHFKSCGEIWNVKIPRDPVTKVIDRRSFVVLRGEGAEEMALQLNGSDVGGWKVAVKVIPWEGSEFSTDQLAAMSVAHSERMSSDGISVTGYDTSLLADDVKSALRKHFSSCGLITDVFVLNRRALIYFFGVGAVRKALKRSRREVKPSASGVGGWKLVAKAMPMPKPKYYIPDGPGIKTANETVSSSDVRGWKLVAKALPILKPKQNIPEGPGIKMANETVSSSSSKKM